MKVKVQQKNIVEYQSEWEWKSVSEHNDIEEYFDEEKELLFILLLNHYQHHQSKQTQSPIVW